MVAPHFRRNPASCTAGKTPSSSKTGILAGRRDSPIWSRGKSSRSKRSTPPPWRARMGGGECFPDVATRKPPPLQGQPPPALARQHGGGGATTWTATNHDHIGGEI